MKTGRWLLIAGVIATLTSGALASLSVTLVDTDGDAHTATNVMAGDVLSLLIQADTDEQVVTLEMCVGASVAEVFDLTALAYGTGWEPPGTMVSVNFNPPAGLDPTTDVGSSRTALLADPATGAFTFATLQVTVDPAAADGTYTLNLSAVAAGNTSFDTIANPAVGPDYTVTIGTGGGTPPGGGGGGGTDPPDDGGNDPPPPDDGDNDPPPPDDGGTVNPPPDDGGTTNPPDDDSGSGVDDGGGSLPSGDNDSSPQDGNGADNSSGDETSPPPARPVFCGPGSAMSAMLTAVMLYACRRPRRRG